MLKVNFLEELIAEWYQYRGLLVMRNINLKKSVGGGIAGEIDILAFYPPGLQIIHAETSADSKRWRERIKFFKEKFKWPNELYYNELRLPQKARRIDKIAIIHCSDKPRGENKTQFEKETGAKLITFSEFMKNSIIPNISKYSGTIPETFPLLRAIQLTIREINKEMKKKFKGMIVKDLFSQQSN